MFITLTFEQAEAGLEAAAAVAPERSLADMGGVCTYFFTEEAAQAVNETNARKGVSARYVPGQACCIVGQVLQAHGVTLEDVGGLNEGCTVKGLFNEGVLHADPRTLDLLSQAQEQQDSGSPWAWAVKRAKEVNARNIEA